MASFAYTYTYSVLYVVRKGRIHSRANDMLNEEWLDWWWAKLIVIVRHIIALRLNAKKGSTHFRIPIRLYQRMNVVINIKWLLFHYLCAFKCRRKIENRFTNEPRSTWAPKFIHSYIRINKMVRCVCACVCVRWNHKMLKNGWMCAFLLCDWIEHKADTLRIHLSHLCSKKMYTRVNE